MTRYGFRLAAFLAALMSCAPAWASEEAGAGGLPQLDVTTYTGVLFWMLATFVVFFLYMHFVGIPGVQKTVSKRRVILEGDLEAARRTSEEAKDVASAYEDELTGARSRARDTVGSIIEVVSREASEAREKQTHDLTHRTTVAQRNLAEAKKNALTEAQNFANDLVTAIVEKVLHPGLDTKKAVKK
ncbi:MAG: hypothetical protein FWF24_06620 [Alphaproteobacteria bacterium]|nr:hypothetical protein [Alphaproteobacteria bacterium]